MPTIEDEAKKVSVEVLAPQSNIAKGVKDTPVFLVPTAAETIKVVLDRADLPVGRGVRVQCWISYHDGTKWDFLIGFGTYGESIPIGESTESHVLRRMKPESKFQRQIMLKIDAEVSFKAAARLEFW